MQLTMPPHAAPQNAGQKSVWPKNIINYSGMTAAGGTAPPTSLTKTTQKSVLSKSLKPKLKQKREVINKIRIQEGETLSKRTVRKFKLNFVFAIDILFL